MSEIKREFDPYDFDKRDKKEDYWQKPVTGDINVIDLDDLSVMKFVVLDVSKTLVKDYYNPYISTSSTPFLSLAAYTVDHF